MTAQRLFPLALFILALAVRLPALGQFLTVDEPDWLARSRHFTAGLLWSDHVCPPLDKEGRPVSATGWGCTFHTVHPGVTTMWAGSIGLLGYYAFTAPPTDLRSFLTAGLETTPTTPAARRVDPALIAPMRLPLVVFAVLSLVAFYLVAARLTAPFVATMAALLLALDPFHSGLSRVLHQDMLTASFMSLAWLMLLGVWLEGWSRRWLALAAISTGLACLSKPMGWFILGYYVAGCLVLSWHTKTLTPLKQIPVWLGWVAVTFVAFFPAMLTMPVTVLTTIFEVSADYATSGHVNGHYFLGRIVDDPGLLFYPLTWLWRTSPIIIMGLLLWGFAPTRQTRHMALLVLLFLAFETVSSKKMDRYFLPAYPLIALIAAQGWQGLTDRLPSRRLSHGLVAVLILSQTSFIYWHAPYYLTYYNPLLGGTPQAAQVMTLFGWGEGMEQAAQYLNQQPQPESLRVVSGYADTLTPFFMGQVEATFDTYEQLTADYNIYYVNQWQRELYNPDVWHYFQRHATPRQRITFHGQDYVLIYARPMAQTIPPTGHSLPQTQFLGYTLTLSGPLQLLWQNLGLTEPMWAGLTPSQGGETHWVACALDPAFAPEAATPAAILMSHCPLTATSGLYDLHFGAGHSPQPSPFPAGRLAVEVTAASEFQSLSLAVGLPRLLQASLPPTAQPLDVPLKEWVRLVAYTTTADEVQLYWQAQRLLNFQELPPILQLRLAETSLPLIPPALTSTTLQVGQVISLTYPLPAAPPLQACIMADSPIGCVEITK